MQPKPPRRTACNRKIAGEICDRLAAGESLKAIGRDPTMATLLRMTDAQRRVWQNHFSLMRHLDSVIQQQRGQA